VRRLIKTTCAALAPLAAAAIYLGLTLPPRTVQLAGARPSNVVYGGYHIHSSRSDGTGTVDEIASAAARVGLSFIILTDHGDARRAPLPPQYLHGVLCIDAVEIGTAAGHLVALGLREPSPYPLAGDPADVLDDVHRQGGWGIIAHPDSPNPGLRWRAWAVPYDAVEWLNADSEWRDKTTTRLTATAGRYLLRAPESLASLFTRPVATLRRWDSVARGRPVVGLAGLDAHARIGWTEGEEPRRNRTILARPAYDDMFRTLTQAVRLERPLGGDASADATLVLGALTAGHTFSVVSAIAAPASLEFTATNTGGTVSMGDRLLPDGSPIAIEARIPEAPAARLVLLHDGVEVAAGQGSLRLAGASDAGEYRVEASYPGWDLPWIVSNPIYGQLARSGRPDSELPPPVRFVNLPSGAPWTIEHDPTSAGAVTTEGHESHFQFRLASGTPSGQFAALVSPVDGDAGFDRVQFTARADRPMRLSVQVRLLGGRNGQRWRKSVYVDDTPRLVVLRLQDFAPVGIETTQRPIVARVHAVLFVVDTVNTTPGAQGSVWLSGAALGVGNPDR
jgi:hypothetical protein